MEDGSLSEVEAPLVPSHEGNLEDGAEINGQGWSWRSQALVEARRQLWLAGPLIVVNLLQFSVQVVSIMFIGHLGELALSSASIATSFAAVTGYNVLLGIGTALETLCGQSYGAKQDHLLGVHMQRAALCIFVASIPLATIWYYTAEILIALGQDHEISTQAGIYARWMIPSLYGYGLLQCTIRFLQTQNIVFPMMISSGIAFLLHIPLCWILVFKSGLGNKGAALAITISSWINVLFLMLYVKFSPACTATWTGFSREAFLGIPRFLKLATSSAIMICLEFWAFEMVILLSGLLPNPKLETSVLSISLNTCWMVYNISVGLGGAVSTRVSNELGAGNTSNARLALHVMVVIAVTEGIIVAATTVLVRGFWGKLYSNEEEVITYVANMLPLLALSNFLDGMQCVLSGAARGCGWQNICSLINFAAYYAVGIPSAVIIAFVFHVGGKGLWLGIICALSVQLLMLVVMNLRTDWDKEARKAVDRVYSYANPLGLSSLQADPNQ